MNASLPDVEKGCFTRQRSIAGSLGIMYVQCKQMQPYRFLYCSKFCPICLDVVSKYMYQNDQILVAVQPIGKLLVTDDRHFEILYILRTSNRFARYIFITLQVTCRISYILLSLIWKYYSHILSYVALSGQRDNFLRTFYRLSLSNNTFKPGNLLRFRLLSKHCFLSYRNIFYKYIF